MENTNSEMDSSTELKEWIYPDVNTLMRMKHNLEIQENTSLNTAKAEVEKLKSEYEKKLKFINELITKLENPLQILDQELFDLIQETIQLAVRKLIYKELKTDSKLINKMISELKESIQVKNGVINVFLSAADYGRLNEEKNDPSMIININPDLNEGDVIIKSNYSEIHSILNDRIEKIFGKKK